VEDPWALLEQVTDAGGEGAGAAVIGTPDDMVKAIRSLQALTGGFGVVLGFAHDWANLEATRRSWDLVARYVIPELNGALRPMQASADFVETNKGELMAGASKAVMAKIMENDKAQAALGVTMPQMAERKAQHGNDPVFRPGAGVPQA